MKIKLVLTDVDGCLTDNSVIYTEEHQKIKKFNMQDGMGINILKEAGIMCGIISGDGSLASKFRAEDLKMDIICINVNDKLDKLEDILKEYNLSYEEIAYMGDDLQDLPVLEKVGFSVAPANAVDEVKENVAYVTTKKGGEGAFREFVEIILKKRDEKL